jgi:MFS family permease
MSLVKKYYLITALLNAYFPLGVWTLYFVERWGYSFTRAMIIFAITFFTSALLDFVGGVHADVIGRKKSAVIGIMLEIVGCLTVAVTGNFVILAVSAVLWGVGTAMISGSLDALIADELGIESKEYKTANSNVQMYLFIARVIASVVGGAAYLVSKPLPYVLSAITSAVALIITTWNVCR